MKKILVIEDNNEVRENIEEILELSGYQTFSAENGKRGLEIAVREKPDLILCDVMMPELDGFGVLKILRNNPNVQNIPLIFLTAKTEKTDFRRGMGLGADDYITKPFEDTDLLEAIEVRLSRLEKIQESFDRSEKGISDFFNRARSNPDLDMLSEEFEVRNYAKKAVIYDEGQYPQYLFLVLSGQVKVCKSNDIGKEFIVQVCQSGDFFGYISLIKNESYNDSAIALEDCEIRMIPKKDFEMLLNRNRMFSAQFIKLLANDMADAEDKLIGLAYDSVRRKLATTLLELTRNTEEGHHIKILREDLANMLGTAKETVIRTLSDFKDEELIEIHSDGIRIMNREKLDAMPN